MKGSICDCAREKRSELFVMAELFTGSEDLDRIYTTRVGLTYLIREAMQARVHHFGGQLAPVGAFMRGSAIPSAIDIEG
jgi:glycogen debranching enzyme